MYYDLNNINAIMQVWIQQLARNCIRYELYQRQNYWSQRASLDNDLLNQIDIHSQIDKTWYD